MSSERKSEGKEFLAISSSDAASAKGVAETLRRSVTIVQTTFLTEGLEQAHSPPIRSWHSTKES
jgi:hypothetical protein